MLARHLGVRKRARGAGMTVHTRHAGTFSDFLEVVGLEGCRGTGGCVALENTPNGKEADAAEEGQQQWNTPLSRRKSKRTKHCRGRLVGSSHSTTIDTEGFHNHWDFQPEGTKNTGHHLSGVAQE
eukprot:103116-Amphidinium_carterae.1